VGKTTRRMRQKRAAIRPLAIGALAAIPLLGNIPSAGAVTIGQLPADMPPNTECVLSQFDLVQPTVTSGNGYVVPNTGGVTNWTLTSWSHFATAGAGQQLTMKVFRKVADPNTYQAVVHDGPRPLSPAQVNTFSGLDLAVKAGDILGVNDENASAVHNACTFPAPGDAVRKRNGNLADGQSGDFDINSPNHRVNATAEVVPTNTIAITSIVRNKKKGNATANITVPNPGVLTVTGKGARLCTVVPKLCCPDITKECTKTLAPPLVPGTVALKFAAIEKKKRKLQSTGKVKVTPTFTFTPNDGTPFSISQTMKLKKKKK
jgi:hypothetical protein